MLTAVLLLLAMPLATYVIWYALSIALSVVARRRCCPPQLHSNSGKIALLYPTCNDFNPAACETLLDQEGIECEIFILDDSTDAAQRKRIDNWVCSQDKTIQVIRRSDRSGYKGGNVNHWLAQFGDPAAYPYVLLVDADEYIPPDFTFRLLECLKSGEYVFAQGCHQGTAELSTPFQVLLHPQVDCGWFYQVPARNVFGMPVMLGHGVLLRTKTLIAVGGFPNLVSEDLALTIMLAERKNAGIIATNAIGREEFPNSYRSYWRRQCRWIRADTEVVRKMLKRLWQSCVGWVARLDLSARELRLPISSLYWILLFIVAVSELFAFGQSATLPPLAWSLLPFLLIADLPALSFKRIGLTKGILYVVSITFVKTAASSIYPLACWQGLSGLRSFDPTGSKHRHRGLSFFDLWELLSGLLFFVAGLFGSNWALAAVGLAVVCSPLMRSRWELEIMVVGTVLFWSLILYQVGIDVSIGSLPLNHLLVLIGLATV